MALEELPESVVRDSVFEGLFVHVLHVRPDGPEADALRRVGFDLRNPQAEYSGRVWKDALELACQFHYPELSREEAQRTLGRRFIEGFVQTLAGRVLKLILPMVGPEGVLRRLHPLMSIGSPNTRLVVSDFGAHDWRVEFQVRWAMPDFVAGLLETALSRTGPEVQVQVLERSEDRYLLAVRW